MEEASPQLENGYTRLANELLDALIGAGLTARQWAVVMAVIRKTYGFNKKSDEIGLSQLSLSTGIDKSHVSRAVRELEALNVLTREAGTHGHRLGVNKNHKQWGVAESATGLPNQQRLLNEQLGVAESATLGVAELAIQGLPNQQPQKKGIKDKVKTTPKDSSAPSGKISLDADGVWHDIPIALMATWVKAYPALSLDAELSKAAAWIIANPKNKKSNYARFLTNWLTRAQDKAPKHGGGNDNDDRPRLVL